MGFDSVNHIIRHEFSGTFYHDGTPHDVTVKTFYEITSGLGECEVYVDGLVIRDEELIGVVVEELLRMGHDSRRDNSSRRKCYGYAVQR